jgi:hypothetical protein
MVAQVEAGDRRPKRCCIERSFETVDIQSAIDAIGGGSSESNGCYDGSVPQGDHGSVPKGHYGSVPQGDHSSVPKGHYGSFSQGDNGSVAKSFYGRIPSALLDKKHIAV